MSETRFYQLVIALLSAALVAVGAGFLTLRSDISQVHDEVASTRGEIDRVRAAASTPQQGPSSLHECAILGLIADAQKVDIRKALPNLGSTQLNDDDACYAELLAARKR